MLGVGISALPSDLLLFDVDAASGQNRRTTLESLDIMLRLWTRGRFEYDGEFWNVRPPETQFDFLGVHLQAVPAAASADRHRRALARLGDAEDRRRARLHAALISLNLAHTASHWSSVEAGAARSGRTPDRRDWRLVKRGLRRAHRRRGAQASRARARWAAAGASTCCRSTWAAACTRSFKRRPEPTRTRASTSTT